MIEDGNPRIVLDYDEELKNAMGGMFKTPEVAQSIKGYGRWVLYAVKAEITISELRMLLYWQSIVEFGLIVVTFVLLMIQRRYLILIHILHFIRPVIGFKVISGLPRSHDIYEEMPSLSDVSVMQPVIYSHFQRAGSRISGYVALSAVSLLLDIVGCIIAFTIIGGDHNADMLYGVTAWIFLCFDCFLIFWYNTLRWAYPDEIWQNIRTILKSGLSSAQSFLGIYMLSVRNKFRSN